MITGHKDRKKSNLHKETNKKLWPHPFGVAYVSRVENQAKSSSNLYFLEAWSHLTVVVCSSVFIKIGVVRTSITVIES